MIALVVMLCFIPMAVAIPTHFLLTGKKKSHLSILHKEEVLFKKQHTNTPIH